MVNGLVVDLKISGLQAVMCMHGHVPGTDVFSKDPWQTFFKCQSISAAST